MLVLDAQGHQSWTNKRSARRIVERGLAARVSKHVIQMHVSDARYCSEPRHLHGPALGLTTMITPPRPHLKLLIPLGYLHYPHRWQTSQKGKAA